MAISSLFISPFRQLPSSRPIYHSLDPPSIIRNNKIVGRQRVRAVQWKKKREREGKKKKKKKKCRIANKSWTIFENYSWQNADSTAINNFAVLVDARKKYHPPGTSKGFFFFFSSLLETSPDSRPGVNGSLFFFLHALSRARARAFSRDRAHVSMPNFRKVCTNASFLTVNHIQNIN